MARAAPSATEPGNEPFSLQPSADVQRHNWSPLPTGCLTVMKTAESCATTDVTPFDWAAQGASAFHSGCGAAGSIDNQ